MVDYDINNCKKIEVHSVKEVTLDNGKKFLAYKAVTKSGKLIDLKFTRLCAIIPTKPCFIYVLNENVNIQRNLKFPVMWVKEVEETEDFPVKEDEDI